MSTYSDYSDYSEDYSGSESLYTGSDGTFEDAPRPAGGSNYTPDPPQAKFDKDPYVAPEPTTLDVPQASTAKAGIKTRSSSTSSSSSASSSSGYSKSAVGNPVRKCTDVFFLLLFLASWVGMFFVAGYAFDEGDPERIYFPMDSQGNFCGKNNVEEAYSHIDAANRKDFSEAKFLYFMDPTDITVNRCVTECPTSTSVNAACVAFTPTTAEAAGTLAADCVCPYSDFTGASNCYPQYESSSTLRRCVPLNLEDSEAIQAEIDRFNGFFQSYFTISGEDSGDGFKLIAAGFGVAVGLSLIYLFIMWAAAPIVVWGSITVGYAGLVAGCVWLILKARDWTDDANAAVPTIEDDVTNAEALTVTSYVCLGIVVILGLVILFMAKRINLAIGIVRAASKTCGSHPSVFLSPIFSTVVAGAVFAWAIYVAAYLYSAGEITVTNGFREFDHDRELQGVIVYHAFWASWSIFFVLGLTALAVALVTTQSFFHVPQVACGAYFAALAKAVFYHAGSVAFGTMILAIVFAIRVAFQFLKKELKGYIQSNPAAKLAVCCIECCLACFQRFLEFLNSLAWVFIALHSYPFCKAAKSSYSVIVNNPLRVAAVSGVTVLVLLIGKVFVAALTVLVMQEILESENVERSYILLFLIFLFAYVVATIFFTTYASTIKAVLICAIEDERWNPPGKRHAPQYLQKYYLPREKAPKQAA